MKPHDEATYADAGCGASSEHQPSIRAASSSEQLIDPLPDTRITARDWRPIETAPNDGTNILLGWPTMVLSGYWADWRGRKAWVTSRGEYHGTAAPTHWKPLDAPPTAATPRVDDLGDHVCEHGTAMDVHCCNCHSGFIFDIHHECDPAPPVPDPGTANASEEELVPHRFNSRSPYEPSDDRDIWCKDCEYHRDHQIHADLGTAEGAETPDPPHVREDYREVWLSDWRASSAEIARLSSQLHEAQKLTKIALAELAGYRDGFEGHLSNATYSTADENMAYILWFGKGRAERISLIEAREAVERRLSESEFRGSSLSSQLAGLRTALETAFNPQAASPLQHDGPCGWWDRAPCNCRIAAISAALAVSQEPENKS